MFNQQSFTNQSSFIINTHIYLSCVIENGSREVHFFSPPFQQKERTFDVTHHLEQTTVGTVVCSPNRMSFSLVACQHLGSHLNFSVVCSPMRGLMMLPHFSCLHHQQISLFSLGLPLSRTHMHTLTAVRSTRVLSHLSPLSLSCQFQADSSIALSLPCTGNSMWHSDASG